MSSAAANLSSKAKSCIENSPNSSHIGDQTRSDASIPAHLCYAEPPARRVAKPRSMRFARALVKFRMIESRGSGFLLVANIGSQTEDESFQKSEQKDGRDRAAFTASGLEPKGPGPRSHEPKEPDLRTFSLAWTKTFPVEGFRIVELGFRCGLPR